MYVGTALNGRSEGEERRLLEQDLVSTQIYFTFNTAGDGTWGGRREGEEKEKPWSSQRQNGCSGKEKI
jgi:hypothetical protein